MGRIVGLSRTNNPGPLLKIKPPREPLSIDAPPLSSDEESEPDVPLEKEKGRSTTGTAPRESEDRLSSPELSPRHGEIASEADAKISDGLSSPEAPSGRRYADIKHTTFGKKNSAERRRTPTQRSEWRKSSHDYSSKIRHNSTSVPLKRSRKLDADADDASDDNDFSTTKSSMTAGRSGELQNSSPDREILIKKKPKMRQKYGQSKIIRKAPRENSPKAAAKWIPPTFDIDSPEKPRNGSSSFITHEPLLDSPVRRQAVKFKKHSPTRNRGKEGRLGNQPLKTTRPGRREAEALIEQPQPRAPAFKKPDEIGSPDTAGQKGHEAAMNVFFIEPETSLDDSVIEDLPGSAGYSVCPVCKEAVDEDLLRKYTKGTFMPLRTQLAFCRTHSRKSAEETWKANGYPRIDWSSMDDRLDTHRKTLENILNGESSFYTRMLRDNIKAGKDRTLLKSQRILAPGYYGPRGLRSFQEYIIKNFSSTLRKKAVEDRLVSARGYSHYVQAVLVPELVVRLIMDDMEVPEEKARTIMEETVKIGELLNEDVGDTVTKASESGLDTN